MRCLVLLAEDYEDGREVFAFALRRAGFEVTDVPDGERVVALAIELQPEVMVLDISLPGVDGWTLMEQLQAHPLTKHIPIVVMSAHAYPQDVDRALEAGAKVFLCKPCTPADLLTAIRGLSVPCERVYTSLQAQQPVR